MVTAASRGLYSFKDSRRRRWEELSWVEWGKLVFGRGWLGVNGRAEGEQVAEKSFQREAPGRLVGEILFFVKRTGYTAVSPFFWEALVHYGSGP